MTATTATAPHIRWVRRTDYAAVMGFIGDWTLPELSLTLCRRNVVGMVAVDADDADDAPIGVVLYELHPAGITLLHVAVRDQRRHVGAALMARMVNKLASHRRETLTADVPEANTAALLLLRYCEFRAVGVDRAGGTVRMERGRA